MEQLQWKEKAYELRVSELGQTFSRVDRWMKTKMKYGEMENISQVINRREKLLKIIAEKYDSM